MDSTVLDSHQLWTRTVDVFTVCYLQLQISLYSCKRNTDVLYFIVTDRMLVSLLLVFCCSSREDKEKASQGNWLSFLVSFKSPSGEVACVLSLFHYGFMKYVECGNFIIIVWAILLWYVMNFVIVDIIHLRSWSSYVQNI